MLRFVIATLLVALGLPIANVPAYAGTLDDPESVPWRFRYGLTSSGYTKAWTDYKNQRFLPIDIETDDLGTVRHAGVWQKNTDDRDWASWRNLTSSAFAERWREYGRKGFRPIDQDAALIDGKLRYSLIMVENREGLKWKSSRNLTGAQLRENFLANRGSYKPIDIDSVEVGGTLRYSIVWVENRGRTGWTELRDMSPAAYAEKFEELAKKGQRVIDLDCYSRAGKLNYAAIWEENERGRSWAARRGMTATELRNAWRRYSDQGLRVIDIEVCPASSGRGIRYAAVWRENDSRYDWPGRTEAEEALKLFVENNGAPGVAAAIIANGKVVFRGGEGFADAERGIEAHSGTIYRAASIAKGITGALAFQMQHVGRIDLSEPTGLIVGDLGDRHRHTVLQLLQNAGCVVNYSDTPSDEDSDQTQYDSALSVLTEKQDLSLASDAAIWSPCTPGVDDKYSTHGYTLAAAALEVRGEADFDKLLEERISDPLGLSTLRAETRTGPGSSGERAKLYARDSANGFRPITPGSFENTSWKWAGGGIEASPLDLARFGSALLRNRLFPESVRDEMWSGSPANDNYGAGWDLDDADDPDPVSLVSKRGRQQAALAHIRIDVPGNIVVVAMTNRSYTSTEGRIINRLTAALLELARGNT